MIFDRTFADIEKVKQILKRLKQFATLTQDEIDTLERGTITYNTLNRIENKQKELAEILERWNYLLVPISNRTWTKDDIFNDEDIERLVNNTIALREAFYVIDENQPNPKAEYVYTEINAIEKILQEIGELIDITPNTFQISGTFYSGQRNILPT